MPDPTPERGPPPGPGVDPDVDLRVPAQRAELAASRWVVLSAVAAGGVLGASARHGLATLLPRPDPATFPWTTFGVNVAGCLLLGLLMALLRRRDARHPAVAVTRPFLGTGVIGGFTTFSTHVVEAQRAVAVGAAPLAVAYLLGTLAAALVAVAAGSWLGAAPGAAR
jgi:fluoride exporter